MTTFEPGASDVLTHGFDVRPALDRVAGEQAGAEHHRRVRGVRAGRDRGDHDVAVVELGLRAVLERDRRRVASMRSATCTPPVPRRAGSGRGAVVRRPLVVGRRVGGREGLVARLVVGSSSSGSASGSMSSSASRNAALDSVSETRSCGRFGPASDGHDLAEVELERLGVGRLLGVLVVPQALLLA